MNPDQRSLLRHATRLLIYQQQTQGLPYVGYYNSLTCESYTANYKIFNEHQRNSRRFPGFVDNVDSLLC